MFLAMSGSEKHLQRQFSQSGETVLKVKFIYLLRIMAVQGGKARSGLLPLPSPVPLGHE